MVVLDAVTAIASAVVAAVAIAEYVRKCRKDE